MSKTRSLLSLFLLLLFASLILGGLFGINTILGLPEKAAEVFGPPAGHHSQFKLILLSYSLLKMESELTQPSQEGAIESIQFSIALGESTDSILARLAENGLIPNPIAVRDYLIYTGYDTLLQAGTYNLNGGNPPTLTIQTMLNATPQEISFVILPGWRMEEIAAALPTSGLSITPEQFIDAAFRRPLQPSFVDDLPFGISLEGFFLPDTYILSRNEIIYAEQLIQLFLNNFDSKLPSDSQGQYTNWGLTIHEAVILASIVEKEAVVEGEMSLIASVFYNRLNLGMHLETDPTVQYALGFNGSQSTWWTNPLSLENLRFDSPYNTYLYPGLPPSPIANPSLDALIAVAYPDDSQYYYFRAKCDNSGFHNFSKTYEEHLTFACP
ncbi:MAG: endolytic transglycosylase MltG [Chloroflexota bacterium]